MVGSASSVSVSTRVIEGVRSGSTGELRFTDDMAPPRLASEYIHQNIYLGVSFASRYDVNNRDVVAEGHWMWGSDFPHDEATSPFTREAIRQVFTGVSVEEKRRLLGLNAADLYHFDVEALAPEVERFGPLVEEMEQPLLELPEDANMALLRGIGSSTSSARSRPDRSGSTSSRRRCPGFGFSGPTLEHRLATSTGIADAPPWS